MAEPTEQTSEGVNLPSWDDFPRHRQGIFDSVKDAMGKSFPQSYGGVRMELHDLHYIDPESFSNSDQKQALLQNKNLNRRLRGTYRLYDDKSGELIDERPDQTVLKVPYLTDRGTFLNNGSEITTIRQARLNSGIYHRRKSNGSLEAHVNPSRGTGPAFRIELSPESGIFKINIGQSSLKLHSLLKDLGVSDEEMSKRWGPELLKVNSDAYDSRVFEKAYQRLVRKKDPNHTLDQKKQAIKDSLAGIQLDRDVMERTLPALSNRKLATALQIGQPQTSDTFKKRDYLLLADLLNKQFHANIPLDLPDHELVAHLEEAMRTLMPEVNPEMLQSTIDAQQHTKEAGVGSDGCLMAILSPSDAAVIVDWTQGKVKEKDLGTKGIEHEPHVTARYGFTDKLQIKELRKFCKTIAPVRLTLGEVSRFKGVFGGTEDALIVKCDSPDLVELRKKIDTKFSKVLKKADFSYKPHLTLAYVNPGSASGLDGHARFKGHVYVIWKLVFSDAGSKRKYEIELGG